MPELELHHRPPLRIILGSARSGTTWLQDALALSNGLRTIFEPFHPDGDPEAGRFAHRYLRASEACPELETYLERILSNRGIRLWSDLRVNSRQIFRWQPPIGYAAQTLYTFRGLRRHVPERGKPPLVKLIRGNLLAGWLASQLDARVILLLRHPCSVIASQLRLDPSAWHDFRDLFQQYLSDEKLVSDHLSRLSSYLRGLSDPFEVRTALWCIENAIPIRSAAVDSAGFVFYEDLLQGSDAAWANVLATLDLVHRPGSDLLKAPSQQASAERKSASASGSNDTRWTTQLDREQKQMIQGVLDQFEVTVYSTAEAMPLRSSA